MNKESSYKKISELITRFEEHRESYEKGDYNETRTRRDFIDPFFKALGWDMDNEQGLAESYREVIQEDKIRVDESTRAPDYCFTVYGQKKFYVEAKKPSVEIKDAAAPAYQIRRYGWSAKLPVSIITDFDEFVVYDCTRKPSPADKPSVSRIRYLTCDEYLAEFDFLYDTFSKESVLKGGFDAFAVSAGQKKGTTSVDREFLRSIEEWRTSLALNIALRNQKLNEDEINYSVQQTIDRLIFLRICEDRKIEPYGALKEFLDKDTIYESLFQYFKKADDRYNSGLFDFRKDSISTKLAIDNKILKTIITEMYYPECPYEFSVIPVEILGNAYEQFLGRVIRLTGGHHAKVEEKPEVRKAGGVYYTPQYIVDYIVKNTVGKLVEPSPRKSEDPPVPLRGREADGLSPNEISKLRIVDPACGSGSFLLGAYQYLLDYHLYYYLNHTGSKPGGKGSPITPDGRLTTAEKKRILTNNIYGVDIDTQAVEVTKLSLLLKCLEGETQASVNEQLSLFHERVLPNLESSIKCGNSLIDFDFYEGKLDLEPQEEKKIRPFNWEKAFPEVFKQGGFDVVIGNPPYGAELLEIEKDYLIDHFKSFEYQLNSFSFFIERAKDILKNKGLLSYITPSVFISQHYFKNIRDIILNYFIIKILLILNYKVFQDAETGDTSVFIFQKENSKEVFLSNILKYKIVKDKEKFNTNSYQEKIQNNFYQNPRFEINILSNESLIDKINKISIPLKDIAICIMGIKPYQVGKGRPKQTEEIVEGRIFDSNKKRDKTYKQYLIGKDIDRYKIQIKEEKYIKYGDWLAEPRNTAPFERLKIIVRQTSDIIRASLDSEFYYNLNNIYNIELTDKNYDYKYILGIINSKLMVYVYQLLVPEKGRLFAEIKKVNLDKLPIRKIDFNNQMNISIYDELILHVDKMLLLNNEIHTAILPNKQEQLKNRIEYTDKKIDELVYKLYGLTDEENKIVEGEG